MSICIPMYNGRDFLRECLDSVLAQTYESCEIVVVDDCSSDDGPNIVKEYQEHHPAIRYFRNDKNLGLVGNWNRCIELARGDWIKFVFQDDLIAPTCIEKMMLHATDSAALITCRRDFIFDADATPEFQEIYLHNQRRIEQFFANSDFVTPLQCQRAALENFGSNMFGEPTSVLLHKSVFEKFGLFRSGMINSCDLEYWVRVSIHTGAFYVRESLATFRVHQGATSAVNRGHRAFRKDFLDNLLLVHDFASVPVYEVLRQHGLHRPLPIDLRNSLRHLTQKVYAKADWARRDKENPNHVPMDELNEFYKDFPEFRVNLASHMLWRVKERIANKSGVATK